MVYYITYNSYIVLYAHSTHLDLSEGSLTIGLMFEGRNFFDGDFFLFDGVEGRNNHSVRPFPDVMQIRISWCHIKNLSADRLYGPLCTSDLQTEKIMKLR